MALNGLRNTLAVDSLSDLSIFTPETTKQLGLRVFPHHQEIQPAGNDNKLLCEGVVDVDVLRMGDKTVNNVRFYICDISKSCSPAAGIIGLDLFPELGIEVQAYQLTFRGMRTMTTISYKVILMISTPTGWTSTKPQPNFASSYCRPSGHCYRKTQTSLLILSALTLRRWCTYTRAMPNRFMFPSTASQTSCQR